jgi:hypothetical protein
MKKPAPYEVRIRTIEGKRVRFGGFVCHNMKSMAGRLFQSPTVRSVRVVDKQKNLYLRLVKNNKGKLITGCTVNVPSDKAIFG